MKHLLSKLLVFALTFLIMISAVACKTNKKTSNPTKEAVDFSTLVDFVVEVEEGRDIRVLQLTDIQIVDGSQLRFASQTSEEWLGKGGYASRYRNYLRQVITRYNPDLILMTGDNVYGQFDDSGESLLDLISFMDSFEIPWAPILGNHDTETYKGVDWQCEQYENSKYCLFKQRTLTGNGNYSVGIVQGGVLKRAFYMLDTNGAGNLSQRSISNGHTIKNFIGFAGDQVDWYTSAIKELKAKCPSVKLSFCFHFPLQAFKDASNTYDLSNGAIDLDQVGREGDFGILSGAHGEWDEDYVVWNSFKSLGVDSIFIGHEHINSASIVHEGIRLTYGQKSSTYDSHNYYNSQTGEIKHVSDGSNEPMVGGTCINLSKNNGEIVNPHIMLYDKDYVFDGVEEDDPKPTPKNENVSDTKGVYRGYEFDRYTLEDLGFENTSVLSGLTAEVNSDAYSVKIRIKTCAEGTYNNARIRFNFFTNAGKTSDNMIVLKAKSITVGNTSVDYTFAPDTEYDVELGAIKMYEGDALYLFVKINGEIVDRWALQEVTSLGGNYLYVSKAGTGEFCKLI